MKITLAKLRKIIKEEISHLNEKEDFYKGIKKNWNKPYNKTVPADPDDYVKTHNPKKSSSSNLIPKSGKVPKDINDLLGFDPYDDEEDKEEKKSGIITNNKNKNRTNFAMNSPTMPHRG